MMTPIEKFAYWYTLMSFGYMCFKHVFEAGDKYSRANDAKKGWHNAESNIVHAIIYGVVFFVLVRHL